MVGRVIIKAFRESGGPNLDTSDEGAIWYRAAPECLYLNFEYPCKKPFGVGLTPLDAVQQLAKYMPKQLRDMLNQRTADDIYVMPDSPDMRWQVCEYNGDKPDKAEWLRQRQWYNTYGSLRSYWKEFDD